MSAKPPFTVSCPLCGLAKSRPWIRQGEWTVVRCAGCDLLITWPRPDSATLARIYEDEAYYDNGGMGRSASEAWRDRAGGILGALRTSPRSVLDFGAGEGHFVHALREMGVVTEGVEPSPAGRAAASRLYGLELRSEVSHDLNDRFELVTMVHSLEHVVNPVRTLSGVKALLKPAGMVYIEVPHAGSVDMWWPRRRREILSLPVHLYHFVPATLVRVVEDAGLSVLEQRARWRNFGGSVKGFVPPGAEVGSVGRHMIPGSIRSLWASRVLPWVRRRCPGGTLRLLATRSS
jgi:SAM-dependent methyltransferase